jgi:hypothetical protein
MAIAQECWETERVKLALLEPRDRLDRKQPRKLGLLTVASAIPGFMGRFKRLPEGYAEIELGVARLWCPCMRSAPAVPVDGFAACSRCGRVYVCDGRFVWAARP